jgi:putative ABC transport system permease protein
MTLSAIGGVIGVALGLGIAAIVRHVSPLATATPLWSIVVGLVVSISIGLFFGIYPAVKAASLDPIEGPCATSESTHWRSEIDDSEP